MDFVLTEEMSRWAFEVKCKLSKTWDIVFTNPTAGPWKTIQSKDDEGNLGEVYRFGVDEERPDIIIVNDELKEIIIIEAKNSIDKLIQGTQIEKSVKVVGDISSTLKTTNNKYWGQRKNYPIVLGILWGAENTVKSSDILSVFSQYREEIRKYSSFDDTLLVGIQTKKIGTDLRCSLFYKDYSGNNAERIKTMSSELSLDYLLI